jgi:hypothetical protein
MILEVYHKSGQKNHFFGQLCQYFDDILRKKRYNIANIIERLIFVS